MRITAILPAVVLLVQPACADEGLRSCLRQAASQLHFNGVARAERGADIVEDAFGTADANRTLPVEPTTQFNIASAGKMFTAVAIGQLVDSRVVSFVETVGDYLNDVRPDIAKITIRQLLAHTSGLGDYLKPANLEVIEKARTATALLPLALADPPAFQPGSKFAYSNSGYVVLGAIIEQLTHKTFAEYLQAEIFSPAAMASTTLDDHGGADPLTRMSPAGVLPKPILSPLRLSYASPAGGEMSTAADMARFLGAMTSGHLVAAATRAQLFTAQATPGGTKGYGLGFNISSGPPLKIGHGGGAPGINAEIALFPASGWKIVTLSNFDPPTASRLEGVLEKVMFAGTTTAAACEIALKDPALVAPTVMTPPR